MYHFVDMLNFVFNMGVWTLDQLAHQTKIYIYIYKLKYENLIISLLSFIAHVKIGYRDSI